ncbi:MAG: translocation/assembly module TamB, partial [Pseudomonadota bacterium]
MLKKITKVLSITLASLLIIVFCLLFTAPGNHFIAYTANKLVDGLKINLPSGRFLYNDAFDVHFENQGIKLEAKQLKIDLFWWRCDGICLDNLSAQSIDLSIKSQAVSTEQSTEAEPEAEQAGQINLPMKVAVKRVAINRFNLAHPSADVTVNKLNLSGRGEASDITVDTLTIADVAVMLHEAKEQPKSAPLTELPALPAIDITLPINVELKQFQISKVAVTPYGAEEAQLVENIELVASAKGSDINLEKLAASYQQWQLHSNLMAELSGENTIEGAVSVKSTEHQAKLSLSGPLEDLTLDLVTQGAYPAELKGAVNLKQTNYPFDLTGQIAKWQITTDTQQLQLSEFDLKAKGHADAYAVDLSLVTQLDALPAMTVKSQLQGSLTNAKLEQLSLNANDSKADINASVDWSNGVKSEFKGVLSHLKAQYLT